MTDREAELEAALTKWRKAIHQHGASLGGTCEPCAELSRFAALSGSGDEVARLREALMEYGNHHASCVLEHHAPGVRDCGCGWVGALRAALEKPKGVADEVSHL
jgi:hypothetical protein